MSSVSYLDPWGRSLSPDDAPVDIRSYLKGQARAVRMYQDAPTEWEDWAHTIFPRHTQSAFGERHRRLWQWAWDMTRNKPPAFVGIWPRGGAKSTSAELIVSALGARKRRRYCLYVRRTQDNADKSVANIAALLEDPSFAKYYPEVANRALNKYGSSKGWRRNRLHTASGFVVDAMGLDTAARGAKVEEQRPDLIVIDDIDQPSDSVTVIEKNIEQITTSILPAGSPNSAVLCLQNLIIPDGFFGRLVSGEADYLQSAVIDGPYPALYDLEVDWTVNEDGRRLFHFVSGVPSWEGQDLALCQQQAEEWGYTAFMREAQHDMTMILGGVFDHLTFTHVKYDDIRPDIKRVVVAVDPAIEGDGDAQGISVGAILNDKYGTIATLWAWEAQATPQRALVRAITTGVRFGASVYTIESDQGGRTWVSVFKQAWQDCKDQKLIPEDTPFPTLLLAKAGSIGSKRQRAEHMLPDYETGRIVHCDTAAVTLENALRRFPKRKPFDLADAQYWMWHTLRQRGGWSQGAGE